MKQFIFIFFFLFLCSSAYALNLTGGELITFDVGEEFEYYEVVGNSTTLDHITITSSGTEITIEAGLSSSSDTFSLIFFNQEKEIIYETRGGGSKTKTIYKDKIIDNTIIKEVEVDKIVEVEDQEEIDRLLGIANQAVDKEHLWKLLFVIAIAIILIITIIKLKNIKIKKEVVQEDGEGDILYGLRTEDKYNSNNR